ncbi:protein-export chaperone SecB [Photobacterium halotolerans]|uniref:protein-export chaperone SecB n=1 Tax=Photobacterium halotolerans TaxID=265726 RepID=UPI0013725642|nr:protein-export chaperone SecB [Photobacterium halotolerans]NAW86592.1 preprotein translocase subunit SecB [Photobacterium halotolerans]
MNLQLISTRVESLEFIEAQASTAEGEEFNLKYGNGYSSDSDDTFQVTFDMILGVDENRILKMKYSGTFQLSEKLTDRFKESTFPRVNAPAIAYPFLRSFVGTFLLNAGYDPILLPSVNFSALDKKRANSQ